MTRCSRIRRWLGTHGTAELEPRREAELRAHLAGCPDCAARARAAVRLTADLERLRVEAPLTTDVAGRVLARIAVAAPPARAEVSRRQLAWTMAGVLAVVLAGLATAVANAPQILDALERSGAAAHRLRTVLAAVAAPARRLFEVGGEVGLGMCGALFRAAAVPLGGPPSISALAWIALLVFFSTTALVLTRDLRRSRGSRGPDQES